jgi:hypothetical protein
MKFEKLTPGMVLYDVHKERMGNTTMRSVGVWPVKIVSLDVVKQTAMASWNGNPPQLYFRRGLEKLRAKAPVLVGEMCKRVATRAEVAAMEAKKEKALDLANKIQDSWKARGRR